MTKIRLASPLQQDSIVDGPGIRMVLWTQGCEHHCPGCHNPKTHDRNGGTLYDVEPFLQAEALIPIAQAAKARQWSLWAYSGFTFEQLMTDTTKRPLLELLDVLVDGKFVEALKDYRLKFKGSKNQRIIDVRESLKQNKVILSSYDDINQKID